MARVAFRQVRGRRFHPNWRGIIDEAKRTLDAKTKPDLIKEHQKRVANWQHKPKFRSRKLAGKGGIGVYVWPVGKNQDIWRWVSLGTSPHVIRPKHAKALAFPSVFTPKTAPIDKFGMAGSSGGPTVVAMQVEHPGTEARKFEEGIAEKYKPTFTRDMENAMRRGARRA